MAEAALRGAERESGVRTRLLPAAGADAGDVIGADGYLFVMPENLASMSGMMKDFFDRTYYSALDRVNGRPYVAMVCAGSDGSGAVRQVERIATGWRLRQVAPSFVVCVHAQTPEAIAAPKVLSAADLDRCEEIGTALAAGLSLGVF